MKLVKDDALAAKSGQEPHGIAQAPAHRELVAVEVLDIGERRGEARLADPADAGQPDDGAKAPEPPNTRDSLVTPYHVKR